MQILATEHWSLLATRSMTWNEIFSRTGTFLTVLSAAVIALSLVAQNTGFGDAFETFALLVLSVVLLVGLATYLRLVEADIEDAWLVAGMNRLRHAYLEVAPDLAPYFITSGNDDIPGMLRTYAFRDRVGPLHVLGGSPMIIGLVEAVVGGVLAGVVAHALGAATSVQILVGAGSAVVACVGLGAVAVRYVGRMRHGYQPTFPAAG